MSTTYDFPISNANGYGNIQSKSNTNIGGWTLTRNGSSLGLRSKDAGDGGVGTRMDTDFDASAGSGFYWFIDRIWFVFDTRFLPRGAGIVSAVLRVYPNLIQVVDAGLSAVIVPNTQADLTNLATTDWANITFSNKGSLSIASISLNQYNEVPITDTTILSPGDITHFTMIYSNDLNNSPPTGNGNNYRQQDSSQPNPPILRITYDIPPQGFMI